MRGLAPLGLAVTSALVALALVEAGLRLARPHSLSPDLQPLVYEHDPEIGYRYRAGAVGRVVRGFEIDNVVRMNALGFHDVERDLSRRDVRRIVAIGDSFTSAKHVPVADGWTQTLERALRAGGHPTAEVVNLGLDGTGTDVHVALLARWAERLRPELVVLAFFVNDPSDMLAPRKQREEHRGQVLGFLDEGQRAALRAWVDAHQPGPLARWLFEHVWLVRPLVRLSDRWQLLRTNYVTPSRIGLAIPPARRDRAGIDAAFQRLDALARRHGFRVVVAPIPPRRHPRASAGALRQWVSPAVRERLDVVNVVPAMAAAVVRDGRLWTDLYWRHDGHFNAAGYRLFGSTLAPEVARRLDGAG